MTIPTLDECCDTVWRNVHVQYRNPDRVIHWARSLWYLSTFHAVNPSPVLADLLRVWNLKKMQHSDPVNLARISLVVMRGDELTYLQNLQIECLAMGGAA